MTAISFVVPGIAQAWQRTGGSGKNRFTKPETKSFEAKVGWYAKAAGCKPTGNPVRLTVVVYLEWPKSKWLKRKPRKMQPMFDNRQDGSNYLKAVEDGMNGIAYVDDKQIVDTRCMKFRSAQGDPAFTEVTIEEIPLDSSGNPVQLSASEQVKAAKLTHI